MTEYILFMGNRKLLPSQKLAIIICIFRELQQLSPIVFCSQNKYKSSHFQMMIYSLDPLSGVLLPFVLFS